MHPFTFESEQPLKVSNLVDNVYRQDDIPAAPFRDASLYAFTAELEQNYETIK